MLLAEIDYLRKDAARYDWIRKRPQMLGPAFAHLPGSEVDLPRFFGPPVT